MNERRRSLDLLATVLVVAVITAACDHDDEPPPPTPVPAAAATSVPEPTATATPEPEPTATPTPEPEPTATPTPEPEPTATATPEPEPTPAELHITETAPCPPDAEVAVGEANRLPEASESCALEKANPGDLAPASCGEGWLCTFVLDDGSNGVAYGEMDALDVFAFVARFVPAYPDDDLIRMPCVWLERSFLPSIGATMSDVLLVNFEC